MTEDIGRSPDGSGSREPSPAVSAVPASIPNAVPLSANERAVLLGMSGGVGWAGEPWYRPFKWIAEHCDVPPILIRRTVRALARKGLASFSAGLWTEDGEPGGAGYTLTTAGRDRAEAEGVNQCAV